ncbi:MAG: acyl-protein synthetase [Bryobacterales bacterium]|nr:acyl-protein synthetase [Bryobacterales bacterium]
MTATLPPLDPRLADGAPYALAQDEKRALLVDRLAALTRHHYRQCPEYARIIDRAFGGVERAAGFTRLEDAPFLPVSLFKQRDLKSIPPERVFKVLTSSGTTGQAVSRIYLDAETANQQARTLVRIVQHFAGAARRPMVIIDHPGVVKDRRSFSARGAGILGMLQFGRQPFYCLRDDMTLDADGLRAYLAQHAGTPMLWFGFTFMIWQHFLQALGADGLTGGGAWQPAPGSLLFHTGGWKKLQNIAVSPAVFGDAVRRTTGAAEAINFYGMVEQVGSVFFENPLHYLHAPVCSDVIIRDTNTLEPLKPGRPGLVQVVSGLPASYPGHSILTEDLGIVHGSDSPELPGMKGAWFEILGRLPKAELRGCSDTFAASAAGQGPVAA